MQLRACDLKPLMLQHALKKAATSSGGTCIVSTKPCVLSISTVAHHSAAAAAAPVRHFLGDSMLDSVLLLLRVAVMLDHGQQKQIGRLLLLLLLLATKWSPFSLHVKTPGMIAPFNSNWQVKDMEGGGQLGERVEWKERQRLMTMTSGFESEGVLLCMQVAAAAAAAAATGRGYNFERSNVA